MPDLSYYRSLRTPKIKFEGKHAKFVGLMDNNIVKKSYHEDHRDIFEHEVYCLRKLQGLKFIPNLLCVDDAKRTIYMKYCGKAITNLDKYKSKIKKYKKVLEEEYGFFHNDIRVGNVCIDNKNQIYFIDFGWSREFEGVGGYGEGKIGNPTTKTPVTKKELLDLLKDIYSNQILSNDYREKIIDIFNRDDEVILEIKIDDNEIENQVNLKYDQIANDYKTLASDMNNVKSDIELIQSKNFQLQETVKILEKNIISFEDEIELLDLEIKHLEDLNTSVEEESNVADEEETIEDNVKDELMITDIVKEEIVSENIVIEDDVEMVVNNEITNVIELDNTSIELDNTSIELDDGRIQVTLQSVSIEIDQESDDNQQDQVFIVREGNPYLWNQ